MTKCVTIPPPHHGDVYVPIDWSTERFDVPGQAIWDLGWLNVGTWMQIREVDSAPLPTILSDEQRTAEICFRLPDGWSVCVPPGIWATDYRNRGYPEILGSAPEFLPPIVAEATGTYGQVVVPSNASEEIPGDTGSMPGHSESGWIDWGIGEVYDWLNPATTPIYNFGGAAQPLPGTYASMGATGPLPVTGTCGKSPCVCGVDSCGRPALIDPRTGKRCYKRRRKRLLTEGDFNDLMRIATLPNTKNVSVALAKAVGRR